jgi:hypothetical protein
MPTRASLSASFLLPILALALAGCGAASGLGTSGGSGGSTASSTVVASSSSGGAADGPWTFTSCVWAGGGAAGPYLEAVSIAEGATFTVTPQGSTLGVTYTDEYGANDALAFDRTTGTSAVLSPGAATLGGSFSGMCVFGPGDEVPYAAQLTATSGTLDYTSGAVFLTVQGTIAPIGTPPCSVATASAGIWIVCGEGGGWAPLPPQGGAPVPQIPTGTYTCGSEVGTYDVADGYKDHVAESGSGTLQITQTGSTTTAAFTGTTVNGTLTFSAASSTAAYAGPGQTVSLDCAAPINPDGPPPPDTETPEPLPVEAGALVMSGTTLYLMFRGTMTSGSPCPGALKAGVLTCTAQ